MSYECLTYSEDGAIATLKLSRPKAMNALNGQLLLELDELLDQLKESKTVRAMIVTGDGDRAFVAGADIKEMADYSSDQALAMAKRGQRIFQKLEDLPFPTIAAVNGFALGGGMELALSCDFIIASEKAQFGLPEVTLGLIPGYGGTQRLSRCVGRSLAKMITFTGDIYSADQMLKWGLLAEVVDAESLIERVEKLAKTMSRRGPVAIRCAKEAIVNGFDLSLEQGLEEEARLFSMVFSTEDHNEGINAFIEKRKPNFKGV